jgi:hypothetical protein
MSHLRAHITAKPSVCELLSNAVLTRHEALRHSAGLNAEVFDALVLLAAGSWEPTSLRQGHKAVAALLQEMHVNRKKRLVHLGFDDQEAEALSSLHTRNFM